MQCTVELTQAEMLYLYEAVEAVEEEVLVKTSCDDEAVMRMMSGGHPDLYQIQRHMETLQL